jgi:hypothetical protein
MRVNDRVFLAGPIRLCKVECARLWRPIIPESVLCRGTIYAPRPYHIISPFTVGILWEFYNINYFIILNLIMI